MTVSTETVRMAKSRPRKNQSERSDLPCHIINLLFDVLLCRKAENFFSLFVFCLALRARQNTAQLVKILSDTTQQNV